MDLQRIGEMEAELTRLDEELSDMEQQLLDASRKWDEADEALALLWEHVPEGERDALKGVNGYLAEMFGEAGR